LKHITVEKVILILAASFAAYNFGLAGGYIEGTHFSVGGLIAGVVVNVSLAIASSRFGSLKGINRTRQARAAFLVMLMLSPVLVSPVVFYSLPVTFLGHWILRALWSVAWPLVADLAIVLAGAVSGKGLISLAAAQAAKPAGRLRAGLRASAKPAAQKAQVYECAVAGCGYSTASQPSLAAHMSHHGRKTRRDALAGALFEKVRKDPQP
jgi:hypothetical protein